MNRNKKDEESISEIENEFDLDLENDEDVSFISREKKTNKKAKENEYSPEEKNQNETDEELKKLMNKEYIYPNADDPNFQEKIYKKREFYNNRSEGRQTITKYEDIANYRERICTSQVSLLEHQSFLSNFINPDTPYRGLLVFHGVGTGKCVHKNAKVFINNQIYHEQKDLRIKNTFKLENIKTIWKKYNNGKLYFDGEGEWSEPNTNLYVNSIDKNNKIIIRPIKRLYRQIVNEKIKVVTLKNGLKIKLTKIHKLKTQNGWKNNYDMNDKIAIFNKIKRNETINLEKKDILKIIEKITKKNIKIPKKIMKSNEKSISKFLKEYVIREGKINQNGKELEIMVKNKRRKKELYHLFKILEMQVKIKKDKIKVRNLKIHNKKKSLESEIHYEKIKNIKTIDYEGYVYDLEIEEDHNYLCEGIIASNTCAAITVAERFKPMVQKYGTKIYVLVSGPLIKENVWKNELLKCTGETYLKNQDTTVYVNEQERIKMRKNAVNIALQYYRFMSYRSFYKKVLGEKIVEKIKTKDNKIKVTYRKNEEGDFERDVAIDRIYNLNNTLVIVDEAHNLTGNAYGEALMKIIANSTNLKVLLLTATPMKNLADDIIELINFIRPPNEPLERDKIFSSQKNHEMELKPNGLEYLKRMTRGYISYLRGADPLTFAKKIDKGEIPKGLYFTKIIRCKMLPFQRNAYDETIRISDDTLDRRSEAIANFAFPGLSSEKKNLIGLYGREGINTLKNQLRVNYELINRKIAQEILEKDNADNDTELINISEDGKSITGAILKIENLKYFSIKFYKALKKLNRLVWGKKGARTAFVYSNLVKVGIEIFEQILLANGYLEFDENYNNYKIKGNTRCYFCGKTYKEHQQSKIKKQESQSRLNKNIPLEESSTEYPASDNIPEHIFHPATFISVTGKSSEESVDVIPEEKQMILTNVFNSVDNLEGRQIKFVLGSRVMNEGISLKNIAEVHILDVYFNLGKVDQVIGRAIRHCSHIQLMSEENPYPQVNVYKYAVTLENELSSEEDLYRKAELKYLLIKKVERALKENAVDCALNRNKNIFPEEISKYQNCYLPTENPGPNSNREMCPALCDYMNCNFKCDSNLLNKKYFDEKTNTYVPLQKEELDYTTFTHNLAQNEIENTKTKIKEMYRTKYLYTLKDIINYVKNTYEGEKKDLFDNFFVYQALNDLTPITENDFNNFKDSIYDKFNRQGYLIYVDKYYIFQPFDQNENVPMYYRTKFDKSLQSQLSLYNYLKKINKMSLTETNDEDNEETEIDKALSKQSNVYDFQSVLDYYENREEFKYVGIIDKESTRRKTKNLDELTDVFKLREKRSKILDKKRQTGLSSYFGSVCGTSRDRNYILKIAEQIGLDINDAETRIDICEKIKNRLLFLEKYSTGKNIMTYMIIPANHPIYKFPLNLYDNLNYKINQIKDVIKFNIDIQTIPIKQKIPPNDETVTTYIIEIPNKNTLSEFSVFLKELGFRLENNKWRIEIE